MCTSCNCFHINCLSIKSRMSLSLQMSKYSINRGLLFNLTFGQGEIVISAAENLTTGLDWKLTKNEDGNLWSYKCLCVPQLPSKHMMTSLKTRHSQTCFFMSHILIKGKAIRYGQLNAKRKQVTDMWHVIHLYSIQINNYFTGILEDLNMVQ